MSKLKSLWSDFDDRDCDKVWYRFLVWIYLKKKKKNYAALYKTNI